MYFGKEKTGQPWLRFKLSFVNSDWIFFDKILFNIDGEKITYIPAFGRIKRDNDSEIWEWCDVSVGNEEKNIINKIINSKSTIARFVGTTYRLDRTVTSQQKQAMKRVITSYNALGGAY